VSGRLINILCVLLLVGPVVSWAQPQNPSLGQPTNSPLDFVWSQSLPVRSRDPGITAIGGTEVRALAVLDHKLFAAIGYWMDTNRSDPALPGARVVRLDSKDSEWRVDLELTEQTASGMRTYEAISNLESVHLTTDGNGNALAPPVDLLLAGVWKRGTGVDVFSRGTGPGPYLWTKLPISGQENDPRGVQVRSFAVHKDRETGIDIVFAGATNAIFVGAYNRDQKKIVWNPKPEWQGELFGEPGPVGRVSSFAECNGKLYAAIHSEIYERTDGSSPAWKKVFEVNIRSARVTGLRGLTSIRDPSSEGEILIASVEDNPARIYRINPHVNDGAGGYGGTLELNVSRFLTEALGTRATYAGIAYNDTTAYPDDDGHCSRLLIGLEVITPNAPNTFGSLRFSPNAYYLVRNCNGAYMLREIQDKHISPKPELVAVRALALSPFADDPPGTVYAGGFDTNRVEVHNTAWVYKGVPAAKAQ
jgi:hypothetical protein